MNSLDKIRLDVLISEVRKIASERPDVVSDSKTCMYDSGTCSDGSVGCLFGQGFAAIDWDLHDDQNDTMGIYSLLDGAGCTGVMVDWCSELQLQQDKGFSWGVLLKIGRPGITLDIGEP